MEKIISKRFLLEQPCKDGSTVWTEVETSLIVDADRNILGVQGVSRDTTERQKYEKELLEARSLAEFDRKKPRRLCNVNSSCMRLQEPSAAAWNWILSYRIY